MIKVMGLLSANYRSRLRRIIRGYRKCERDLSFSKIRLAKNCLTDLSMGGALGVFGNGFFFGASEGECELVLRQFILDRYGGVRLHLSLYESLGYRYGAAFTVPRGWRLYLASQGWKLKYLRSAYKWQIEVVVRFLHGIQYSIRRSLALLYPAQAVSATIARPYVFFESLTPENLPSEAARPHYDICSFYARWSGRPNQLVAICHDVKGQAVRYVSGIPVFYRTPVYTSTHGAWHSIRLAAWSTGAIIIAGVGILLGRWGYAMLLTEAIKARSVRFCSPDKIADEYLFHASLTIYRPMWTYEAARHGASIALYFYSITVQPKLASGYESQRYEWGPSTWPRFIVWDDYQERMLRRDLKGNFLVEKVGAVYFSDSDKLLPSLQEKAIAIFDIHPHRRAAHFGISTLVDLQADYPDYYRRFLSDVVDVLEEHKVQAVLKGKRDIGSRGEKRYKHMIDGLAEAGRITVVAPDISAVRVIEACCAAISIPFTSTALYAREKGIPSVYYDPIGWVQSDDEGAHGIPILQGRAQLRAWLSATLDE